MFLAGKGCEVHVVLRGDDVARSMSRYLVDRLDADPRITIEHRTEVRTLRGENRLAGLRWERTADGRTEDVDVAALFCFIGAVPATSWLSGCLAADDDGFLITDRDIPADALDDRWAAVDRTPLPLETSAPGVFAVGDVRAGSVKRVAAAVGEGSTAIRSVHTHLAAVS